MLRTRDFFFFLPGLGKLHAIDPLLVKTWKMHAGVKVAMKLDLKIKSKARTHLHYGKLLEASMVYERLGMFCHIC